MAQKSNEKKIPEYNDELDDVDSDEDEDTNAESAEQIKAKQREKVIDYCHVTSVYRGAAHRRCNLQVWKPK